MSDTYVGPSDLATGIAVRLWADHKLCPTVGHRHCSLGEISTDDVQEILNLAAELAPPLDSPARQDR